MKRPIGFAAAFFLLTTSLAAKTVPAAGSRYAISSGELQTSLEEVERLKQEGAWLEAKARYQTLLQHDLSDADRASLRDALEDLSIQLLFSPVPTPDSVFYTVRPGDSLYKIAKQHNTTVALLKRINHLASDLIRPDTTLKVSKAVYSIVVNKTTNRLMLYADQEILKTYPVATGDADRTPIGTFTIESKLIDPVWYTAGAVVPADSPDNILGTRWLGFSISGYGIHGTTMPETIGRHVTEGCVRMYNRDVEELDAIVPLKTRVTIIT